MDARLERMLDPSGDTFTDDAPAVQIRRGQVQERAPKQQRDKLVMITDPNIILQHRRHEGEPLAQNMAVQKAERAAQVAELVSAPPASPAPPAPALLPSAPVLSRSVHPSIQSLLTFMSVVLVLAALNWGVVMSMGGRRDAVWFMTTTVSSRARRNVELVVYGFVTAVAVAYLLLLVLASRGEFDERVQRRVSGRIV
jgi:hypothetical protein